MAYVRGSAPLRITKRKKRPPKAFHQALAQAAMEAESATSEARQGVGEQSECSIQVSGDSDSASEAAGRARVPPWRVVESQCMH